MLLRCLAFLAHLLETRKLASRFQSCYPFFRITNHIADPMRSCMRLFHALSQAIVLQASRFMMRLRFPDPATVARHLRIVRGIVCYVPNHYPSLKSGKHVSQRMVAFQSVRSCLQLFGTHKSFRFYMYCITVSTCCYMVHYHGASPNIAESSWWASRSCC